MKSMIVAYDRERTIGRNNELPWAKKLPADMRHFTDVTKGKSVIMGRKTYESLPEVYRPLPYRQNIVISMGSKAYNGAVMAHTLEEAYEVATEEPVIIGGAQIYSLALPQVDRVYATEIDVSTPDGDTFFPPLPEDEWECTERVDHQKDERNHFNYSFATYLRRQQQK